MKKENSASETHSDTAAVTQLALTVFRLNGALLHWGDQLVAPLGLTSARWQMLGAIHLAGSPLTAPQIAEAMGVTRQGAQKQLNLLLEQSLVNAHSNPAHRRSVLYGLTAEGLALYQQADAMWSEKARHLTTRLIPADQADAATQVLEAMLRGLQASPHSLDEAS